MVSASPPPLPPARRVGGEGALQRWRLRNAAARGSRRGRGAGLEAEREGKERNPTGSGAGFYGGRRGTCRAGGCRMVGCVEREGTGTRGAWAVPAGGPEGGRL